VFLIGAAMGACVLAAWLIARQASTLPKEKILAAFREGAEYGPLTIRYPLSGTVFPPEIVPPAFRWEDSSTESDAWVLAVDFLDNQDGVSVACSNTEWTPSDEQWETVKRRSVEQPARVTVLGVNRRTPKTILSAATITIATSKDAVGAPIFYREVDLPFVTSVGDPAAHIRWRFGAISSKQQPPIVLDRLPVCANCHSFSADGTLLGMDIDYANDKGSYVLETVAKEMVLEPSKIITWSDYRREDGETTFGLLSQVSPDGRYVASTVKDQSVFVPAEDLAFSQLFFPIKGILAIYDRARKEFRALPGADDPQFVQSNPSWSPDGKYLIFARSKAYRPNRPLQRNAVLLRREDCGEFLDGRQTFQFDLHRIPFNGGKGGKAEPLRGASLDGMSNYFGRYSPDGKWIVFCKAKSFMLLQPDSRLYIVPAEGGEARPMECNTPRMNSWHSWSPNGRWLVFSSKSNSPYTQLFLTHVDEQGHSTPPVLLPQFTASDRAANIPEFVRAGPGAIERIREQFIDDSYYARSGDMSRSRGENEIALRDFQKSLELNEKNVRAHMGMGEVLRELDKCDEAKAHFVRAIEIQPQNALGHEGLGRVLGQQGKLQEAANSYREALRLEPALFAAHFHLGVALVDLRRLDEAKRHLAEANRLQPTVPHPICVLGVALSREGRADEAAAHFRRALALAPDLVQALAELASILATSNDPALRNGKEAVELATRACELTRHKDPGVQLVLSEAYAENGRFGDAVFMAERVLQTAATHSERGLVDSARSHLESYRRGNAYRQSRQR
jgi:tetratricopeptide (TPR) repeat protein